MNSFLIYTVEANICLGFFIAVFWVIKKIRFDFNLQRVFILGICLASLSIPLLHVSVGHQSIPNGMPIQSILEANGQWLEIAENAPVIEDQPVTAASPKIWFALYLMGCAWFLFKFIRNIMLVRKVSKNSIKIGSYHLLPQHLPSFSFWNKIFINPKGMTAQEQKLVYKHEQLHIAGRHSWDVISLELLGVLLWYNPLLPVLIKKAKENHEFIVDKKMVEAGFDSLNYQLLIVKHTLQTNSPMAMASAFNHSLTKQRLKMLDNQKKPKGKILLFSFIGPILLVPMLLFSVEFSNKIETTQPITIVMEQPDAPGLYPLKEGKNAIITSGYGKRIHPLTKKEVLHRGIDFKAKTNTPVVATAAGKVVFAQEKGAHGNLIILQHGTEYTTQYAHLNSFHVEENEVVAAGEIIGYVGSTGASTAPHLHYEVLKNNQPIDPMHCFK